jgi:glycosyltransferase involved in cell wall biosynthesis
LLFSIIIPVYNRPHELEELLESIARQKGNVPLEVIVVEDGSDITSENIVNQYQSSLNIKYCFKQNSGPGDSRNYGMRRSSGAYFLMLDSDCLLPEDYLSKVTAALESNFTDAFGGPDAAHPSFSMNQKAFNYAMTSLLSTGGLRSSENEKRKFQLRSFNMGMSHRAFELTGGFGKQRIGEDIDLNFRLLEKNLSTQFLPEAFVYHKRRGTWVQFFRQTRSFGAARPILNRMHPGTAKFTYALPSLFDLGLIASIVLAFFGFPFLLIPFAVYFLAVFVDSTRQNRNPIVGLLSCIAVFVQFLGYGSGYLRTEFRMRIQGKSNKEAFPEMFA